MIESEKNNRFYCRARAAMQAKQSVNGDFFLNVVVCKRAALLKLLASQCEPQPLLIRGSAFFCLANTDVMQLLKIKYQQLNEKRIKNKITYVCMYVCMYVY
jgi:hypothetical protein